MFAGYLEGKDTVAAYHLAHIFAFASTSETQGLVIGEAMAAGLPVVAANDSAVEDFVVDGVSAGSSSRAGPEDLAHAFDALLGDEARRLEFSEAASSRVPRASPSHTRPRSSNATTFETSRCTSLTRFCRASRA